MTQLEEDGLLDDTFIFYFGDHGGVLPRGKGYAYECGLHVPLVVRVPENWRHLVDASWVSASPASSASSTSDPRCCNLAGVAVPDQVDGRPFLGTGITADEVNARDESFGYADRFDEKYDLVRTLRKGKLPVRAQLPALQLRRVAEQLPLQDAGLHASGGICSAPISSMRSKASFSVSKPPRHFSTSNKTRTRR